MNKNLLRYCRKDIVLFAAAFAIVLSYTQCTPKQTAAVVSTTPNTTPQNDPNKGLKDYFKDYFLMGVAVGSRSIKTDSALINKEFNS